MTSEIKINTKIYRPDLMLEDANLQSNLHLMISMNDSESLDRARFILSPAEAAVLLSFTLCSDKKAVFELLHQTFRTFPVVKPILTEALLTFDTEAGGKTMDLQAATAEKEEQP